MIGETSDDSLDSGLNICVWFMCTGGCVYKTVLIVCMDFKNLLNIILMYFLCYKYTSK